MRVVKLIGLMAVASLSLGLVSCSSPPSTDNIEESVFALLDDMESGRINDALERFEGTTVQRWFLGDTEEYIPTMVQGYTNRSIDEINQYGTENKPGYLVEVSFDVAEGERAKIQLDMKAKDNKFVFTSNPEELFGTIVVSSEEVTAENAYPAYTLIDGTIVTIGNFPLKPVDNGEREWRLNSVPIGNYAVSVKDTEYVTAKLPEDGFVRLRPDIRPVEVIELAIIPDSIDDAAQASWDGLNEYIIECAETQAVLPIECDSTKETPMLKSQWVVSSSLYVNAVDADNAKMYSAQSNDRQRSFIEVPFELNGELTRSSVELNGYVQIENEPVNIQAYTLIAQDGSVGYKVKLSRVNSQ